MIQPQGIRAVMAFNPLIHKDGKILFLLLGLVVADGGEVLDQLIKIKNGGVSLIRVTDNGSGMDALIKQAAVKDRNVLIQWVIDFIRSVKSLFKGQYIPPEVLRLERKYVQMLKDVQGTERQKNTADGGEKFSIADETIKAGMPDSKRAEILKNKSDIQFLLFGTGGLVDHYKRIVVEKKLDNVKFYPLQPIERVSYVYGLGDLGIVSCKTGLGKGAFPSKTWSIMAAGTPVIANYDADTDLENLIRQNRLGVFTESGNSEQMANSILELSANRNLCVELGKNARNYIERNVSRKVATDKYVKVVKNVVFD